MKTNIAYKKSSALQKSHKDKKLKMYEMDNSAKFYPIIASRKSQSLYCMGAVLKEDVDPKLLEEAVNEVINRFPSLKVTVARGYCWHRLVENTKPVKIFPIDHYMLRPIEPEKTNGYWFRISYGGKNMKIDMFHGLTDGNGALIFLKSILYKYQQLKGVEFDDTLDIVKWEDAPTKEEQEDSFLKYYKPVSLASMDLKNMAGITPLTITGTPVDNCYLTTICRADVSDIKKNAKALNVTLTSYIAGVLAYTIKSVAKNTKHPIVMMIPVNLRNVFKSNTHRNFVTFVRLAFKVEKYNTIEDFVMEADKQLKEKNTKRKMEEFISTTVRAQGNFLMRAVPIEIKASLIRLGRKLMRSRQTIIFSNLGIAKVPEKLGIEKFIFQMNVSPLNPQNLGAITINGKINFAFTRAVKETTLIDTFFDNLKKEGVKLQIDEELSQTI